MLLHSEWALQSFQDPLCHRGGMLGFRDVVQQDGELVATETRDGVQGGEIVHVVEQVGDLAVSQAGHRVQRGDAALQALGDLGQELIADQMA